MPQTRGQTHTYSPEVATPHIVDLTETPSSAPQITKKRKREDEVTTSPQPEAESAVVKETTETEHTKIGAMSCIICLEPYTNATVAHCGHIFCHECLTRALTASEANSSRGQGVCPSCRKPISRRRGNQIIPISFMKKSKFRKQGT